MSDDLVAFLRARLDEDEAVALAVEDNSAPWRGQWKAESGQVLRTYNDWVLVYPHENTALRPGVVDHLARHDPARVLREVEAKRQIIYDYEEHSELDALPSLDHEREVNAYGKVLRWLTLPYAGHADYRAEWKA